MTDHISQQLSPKRRAKRYEHLERLSLTAVENAIRYNEQMASLSAMASAIVRDNTPADEREALLWGFEQLSHTFASEARMDMECLQIAQTRYTPAWKQLKKTYPK
ncbi:MAG TPA: hypothetical protein VGL08_21545 [Paraburkholderia sp.]|jgi:hypothetical protein